MKEERIQAIMAYISMFYKDGCVIECDKGTITVIKEDRFIGVLPNSEAFYYWAMGYYSCRFPKEPPF
tara:strand:- start:1023 stop:1223 length:201 start_codon:yes stop_codon:yes gene_type:complete